MKIVVIGGTGLIGSKVVANLRERGEDAIAAARSTGINAVTGEGLIDALAGASVVIDVSDSPSFEDAAVMEFFETSTRNVLAAAAAAGVGHEVALSVVGTERLPDSGYLRAKLAQEKLIEKSSIPFSLIRATQFFEFADTIVDAATDNGTVRMPPVLFRPVAATDVAHAVCSVALASPLNGQVELAGPDQYRMDDFFREFLAARNDPREVITDHHARYFGTELSERSLVPLGEAMVGETSYDQWRGRASASPLSDPTT